jgi:phage gp29-like protein
VAITTSFFSDAIKKGAAAISSLLPVPKSVQNPTVSLPSGSGDGSNLSGGDAKELTLVDTAYDPSIVVNVTNQDRLLYNLWGPMTPERMISIMREAVIGNLIWQKKLFAKMLDEWPRLNKNVRTLKQDIAGVEWTIEPYADKGKEASKQAQAKAELVERALFGMRGRSWRHERGFFGLIRDLVDAMPCGISVSEIYWTKNPDNEIVPRCSRKLPPRFYGYSMYSDQDDRLMLNETGVLSFAQENLSDFDAYPGRFMVGVYESHDEHPTMSAMLRSLAAYYMAHKFGLQWFMTFCQKFGAPLTVANAAPGADKKTMNDIANMMQNLASASWAVFPDETKLTMHESKGVSGQNFPHRMLREDADEQCDLLLLGQTLTSGTRSGGNRSLGEIHAETERAIINGGCDFVSDVINAQLIPYIIMFNFGDTEEMPRLHGAMEERLDELAMAQRDAILFGKGPQQGLGLPIAKSFLYRRHSAPQPDLDTDDLYDPNAGAVDQPVTAPAADGGATPNPDGDPSNGQPPKNGQNGKQQPQSAKNGSRTSK